MVCQKSNSLPATLPAKHVSFIKLDSHQTILIRYIFTKLQKKVGTNSKAWPGSDGIDVQKVNFKIF